MKEEERITLTELKEPVFIDLTIEDERSEVERWDYHQSVPESEESSELEHERTLSFGSSSEEDCSGSNMYHDGIICCYDRLTNRQ